MAFPNNFKKKTADKDDADVVPATDEDEKNAPFQKKDGEEEDKSKSKGADISDQKDKKIDIKNGGPKGKDGSKFIDLEPTIDYRNEVQVKIAEWFSKRNG